MENVIVIVDLETTGLSSTDQILEIGALKVNIETGEVLDQFQTFSLPDSWAFEDEDDIYHISEFITELTGITDDMIVGAPSNKDAVNLFLEFTGSLDIWAYNAGFDSKFINKFTRTSRPFKDILSIARRAYPDLRSHKLVLVAEHLGLSQDVAHRAIADCLTAKEVLVKGLKITPELHYQSHSFKASDYKAKIEGDFFGKTIVFTGSLITMSRSVAAEFSSKLGFNIGNSVTKRTDLLVVGVQELSSLAGHEKSSKHRKAEELIKSGFDIKIITENDFLVFIDYK